MRVRPWRTASLACGGFLLTLWSAVAAGAGDLPSDARLGVDAPLTAATFRRSFAARFRTQLRIVVTTDIDRDGDLDIVAATEQGVIVWLNDGAGHLTAQAPGPVAPLVGRPPYRTSGSRDFNGDEPVQNNAPNGLTFTSAALAPPLAVRLHAPVSASIVRLDAACHSCSPRAPPA